MQQLQQQQEAVEEVVAEEGAPLGNGLVVRRIEDPTEGSQGEKWGFSSCRSPRSLGPPTCLTLLAPEPSMAPSAPQSDSDVL